MIDEEYVQPDEENRPKRRTKTQILSALKKDMKAADTLRLEAIAKRDVWRAAYNGDPYGNEQKGKSSIVSRDIKRQDEWQHASIKDAFVADEDIIKCKPVTFEDKTAAIQNELVLNTQFTRQFPRYRFMTDVVKLYYSEGTVIVKTGWQYEDKIEEVEVPKYAINPLTLQPQVVGKEVKKKLKVLVNQPDAEICRLEDVYMDPTAEGDVDRAQFFVHRYESDLSSLRKAKKYKNLRKLAMNMAREDDEDFDPTDETNFVFEDQARKKVLVHEYWGNYDIKGTGIATPIVATWVGDTLIQLEDNPYPEKSMPFVVIANNSIPFQLYGEANAELVGDNQKITTAIKRGIMDNMANSNNAQKGLRTGALDAINKKRFLNGKNFEFNGSAADFYDGSFNSIPASVFQVLEMVNSETDSMLGVKGFSSGIQGASLGSTARAAGGVLDAVSVRKLDIVRNIAENCIKPIMRRWTEYNSEFMLPEQIMRITNEEFVPVKRDDLQGKIDISIHVSTAEDNSAKAQELAFMLQTGAQTMDPEEVRMIRAEIARLQKMPDLAKKIEEYQPQPDPFAEKVKELEIRKTEAEIEERLSRARENEIDLRLKSANAALAEARARDLNSGADLKDLDFTKKADGTEFNEKMTEKDHDRETQAGLKVMDNNNKKVD